VLVDIIDVFPHDHPALDYDEKSGSSRDELLAALEKEMSSTLNALVKNNLGGKFGFP